MFKKILMSVFALALLGGGCVFGTDPQRAVPSTENGGVIQDVPVAETFTLKGFDSTKPIESPLVIHGEALGNMYFEASFPVSVLDKDQHVLAQGHAEAQSDWMTLDWVPFTATVTFSKQPSGSVGFLKLENDNPSGLPEKEISGIVPITFK